ncbi:MAG: hypothetical protein EOM19_04050 [Candidatus Moranbacteria bacterium]|nr:hypothetical protein [Candidatus Moranbacteria bacterium]
MTAEIAIETKQKQNEKDPQEIIDRNLSPRTLIGKFDCTLTISRKAYDELTEKEKSAFEKKAEIRNITIKIAKG